MGLLNEKLLAQLGQLTIDITKLQIVLRQKQEEANRIATKAEAMKKPKDNGK